MAEEYQPDEYEKERGLRERRMAVQEAARGNKTAGEREAALRLANMRYKAKLTGRENDPEVRQSLALVEDAVNMRNIANSARETLLQGGTTLYQYGEDKAALAADSDPGAAIASAIRSTNEPRRIRDSYDYGSQSLSGYEGLSSVAKGLRAAQDSAFKNPMTTKPNRSYSLYAADEEEVQ